MASAEKFIDQVLGDEGGRAQEFVVLLDSSNGLTSVRQRLRRRHHPFTSANVRPSARWRFGGSAR